MYKITFAFQTSDAKSLLITLALPFVPQIGSTISFNEELDNLEITHMNYCTQDKDFFTSFNVTDTEESFKGLDYKEL